MSVRWDTETAAVSGQSQECRDLARCTMPSGLSRCTVHCTCTEQECSIVQTNTVLYVQLCSKAQNLTLYFAVYCIGTMVHLRWQTAAGWHQEGLGGPGGSWASPPNTEMENLNVRKYYHSSRSVLYISTPCTVWWIELMQLCNEKYAL